MHWIQIADGPGNWYGGLWIGHEDGRFYWAVENYSGLHPKEIPEYAYSALLRLHNERMQADNPPAPADSNAPEVGA